MENGGINLRRKLPYGADPSLQGFQPIYQSILFRLTLVAENGELRMEN
jgi:hypothetical protein